jgi:hypothetical protein
MARPGSCPLGPAGKAAGVGPAGAAGKVVPLPRPESTRGGAVPRPRPELPVMGSPRPPEKALPRPPGGGPMVGREGMEGMAAWEEGEELY